MMTPKAIVQRMLQSNPNLAQNPNSQAIINAILNDDSQTGMRLAQNMCQTRGIADPQQAANQIQQMFLQNFQGGGRR